VQAVEQLMVLDRLGQGDGQLGLVERLDQEVKRPQLDRGGGDLRRAERRGKYDGGPRELPPQRFDQRGSIDRA
jgi:hypothetical protein